MGASVLLTTDETGGANVKLVAYIDENGHLLLVGYNSDEDYEWGVTVDKEQKDLLLLALIKQSFHSDVTFGAWLEEVGIPYKLNGTVEPGEP